MPIINVQDLTKVFRLPDKAPGFAGAIKHLFRPAYRLITAVDHIQFHIEAGESIAYVGPNGAGKSTTIKMLTGVLVPSSGQVTVRGLVPHKQRVANSRQIGVVFGQRTQLWWDIPVIESLRLIGDIYEIPAGAFKRNLYEFTELLELKPLLAIPARQLSLGQRMRCDIAASMLHSPSILYLDEPTIGLDVAVKERIRQFIRRENRERGMTMLLTSHDLGDIEDLCDRMIMIDKGKILFDGPLAEIRARYGGARMVRFILREGLPAALETAMRVLPELHPNSFEQPDAYTLNVQFENRELTASVVIGRLVSTLPVNDLKLEEPTIESIIRKLYRGELTFSEAA